MPSGHIHHKIVVVVAMLHHKTTSRPRSSKKLMEGAHSSSNTVRFTQMPKINKDIVALIPSKAHELHQ